MYIVIYRRFFLVAIREICFLYADQSESCFCAVGSSATLDDTTMYSIEQQSISTLISAVFIHDQSHILVGSGMVVKLRNLPAHSKNECRHD